MPSRKPRTSLRTLLIGINLVVLLLPLAGIQLMRLYESALVRQTESALIAQGAFVAALYRALVKEQGTQDWLNMTRELDSANPSLVDGQWLPQPPTLDLATSTIMPPFPEPRKDAPPEPFASEVGQRMSPMLKDAQLVTLAGIRVVDPWGTIIASTGDDVGMSISHGDEIDQALAGLPTSLLRRKSDVVQNSTLDSISRTSTVRVFVTSPIVLHGRLIGAVMLSRTPPSIVQALYAKRWLLLQGLTLLIGLVVVMSLLTFRLIANPISRLATQAGNIARGVTSAEETQYSAEAQKPRTVEIARLQEAITNMANTLEQRANYLQDFSRHVSHEFKTPIASIRGAIEVLQDHSDDMANEQRMRFLSNIAADAERMFRLTERLMELTQAEISTQTAEVVDIQATVDEAAASFTHQAQIKTDGVSDQAKALGNRAVLRAVLETFFENAIQHQANELTVWCEERDNTIALFVQDNGDGISASNREHIFTPFFTTQRDHGGTGLGLTIALALIKQIDGVLELETGDGPTTFKLTLRRGDQTAD